MKKMMHPKLSFFFISSLQGISQVILQRNVLSGALFLFGVAVNSINMALGATLGVITATACANALYYPAEHIKDGLFGYNGALTGVVIFSLYAPSPLTILLIIGGSALTVLIMRLMMIHFFLPAFTTPYILVVWVIWGMAPILDLEPAAAFISGKFTTWGIFEGVGQVIFQDNAITGICFLVGILVSNKSHALWALIGVVLATLLAELLSLPQTLILTGIFGYNACLSAIALANKSKYWFAPLAGVVITVPTVMAFMGAGIIALSAPFVISSWAILLLKKCTH
ncbi:urea transporter [Microbulbifer sp. CnH-101-G]|uniref:urea transporter n=1 Tax=Microbulbifer sp. CnH-101-G TaxID=3243393 RepID=UPI00403979C1